MQAAPSSKRRATVLDCHLCFTGRKATSLLVSTKATAATDSYALVKQEFPPGFWNDEKINSLTSSYDPESVAAKEKQMQTLISEIKSMFKSMGDGETNPSAYDTAMGCKGACSGWLRPPTISSDAPVDFTQPVERRSLPLSADLFERLWAVDTVERLGIDRHFKEEIKETLDYVYMYWNERGIGWARDNAVGDIDDTAMGLRILRLHGYNVSSDALKTFRDGNGEFFCFMGQTQRGVTDMLNVHRCSQVALPGEKIMEEAKLCTQRYLTNALENVGAFDKWALKKDLQGEVEYVLKYPWHRSMPRLEARSYIEQYGANDVWLGKSMYLMPSVSNAKYLELAKLDFNNVQAIQQKEIQDLHR
ncbi:hypothetical protein KI387_042368 [Taxus chinensis]|uniref:Terpene synthase N-terminal domain-containing protein n=1 Tax=Taxus chinensis TaxID=29808 RepID=A0AA38CA44_TAXCH|nr:hypothetical protein KI387_042368 [Taxus chinensis]